MNTYRDRDIELEKFVGSRVVELQARYLRDEAGAVAAMARLRRGVGAVPGSRPDIWEWTLGDLPEALIDRSDYSRAERDGAPTSWEAAAHDAITLHAWHQQSRSEPMHLRGRTFGKAVWTLGERTNSAEAVRRRFHALGTATQHDARLTYLRALINQFRAHSVPLDYAKLARDLRRLDDHTYAANVLLEWGRDYHQKPPVTTDSNGKQHKTPKGEDQ
ncbi:type I-E CRISPR-associated protein Cse2/CasB (plasmid) [Nocardia sp. CWNU-33]|uniref:type I-E CRISPR-associated protein Cse2/CasB n=1 Tax=Nocardia sp. CWNU-33 TaxID=3392117 RepID=UPI00398E51A6